MLKKTLQIYIELQKLDWRQFKDSAREHMIKITLIAFNFQESNRIMSYKNALCQVLMWGSMWILKAGRDIISCLLI